MSAAILARRIYLAIRCNNAAAATIREEYAALALSIATDPDAAFELTSSTVNGQTFSGNRPMSNGERLELLGLVVAQLEAGRAMNLRTRAVF